LEYIKNSREILGIKSSDKNKIPWFKFSSNDNWFISPEECMIIVNTLTHIVQTYEIDIEGDDSPEEIKAWILNWIGFNKIASDNGGYTVN